MFDQTDQAAAESAMQDHQARRRVEILDGLGEAVHRGATRPAPRYQPLSGQTIARIRADMRRFRAGATNLVLRESATTHMRELAREIASPVNNEAEAVKAAKSKEQLEYAHRVLGEFAAEVEAGHVRPGQESEGRMATAFARQLLPGRRHGYAPTDGGYCTPIDQLPAPTAWDRQASVALAERYVIVEEGWTEEPDWAHIRHAGPNRPVRYGVTDDGLCPCHPPEPDPPEGGVEPETAEPQRRRLFGRPS
jgi:hypothetical protein